MEVQTRSIAVHIRWLKMRCPALQSMHLEHWGEANIVSTPWDQEGTGEGTTSFPSKLKMPLDVEPVGRNVKPDVPVRSWGFSSVHRMMHLSFSFEQMCIFWTSKCGQRDAHRQEVDVWALLRAMFWTIPRSQVLWRIWFFRNLEDCLLQKKALTQFYM